jgi:hypothetical protein
MGRRLRKGLAGLALGLAGAAAILWIRPWMMAIYHTEIGAREIEAALRPVFPDRLAPEHVQDPMRLARGLTHLQAALAWDPRHLAARRLLARAYAAQNRPAEAEAALRPALEAFPGHPWSRWSWETWPTCGETRRRRSGSMSRGEWATVGSPWR